MNRRHDEMVRQYAVRKVAEDNAADAAHFAAEQQADAEAQADLAELRSLSPAERISRAKRECAAAEFCPNAAVMTILAACASDDERGRITAAIRPIDRQHDQARAARVPLPSPVADPRKQICSIAAKRAMERMGSCGLNVEGFDEASMCNTMTYDKLSFLASRSCSEIATILPGR